MNDNKLIVSLEQFSESYYELIRQEISYSIHERNEDSTIKLFIANHSNINLFYASCVALSVQNEYTSLRGGDTYADDEISSIYQEDIEDDNMFLFYKVDKKELLFDIYNLFSCDQKKLFGNYFNTNNLLTVFYNKTLSEYLFFNKTSIGLAIF